MDINIFVFFEGFITFTSAIKTKDAVAVIVDCCIKATDVSAKLLVTLPAGLVCLD